MCVGVPGKILSIHEQRAEVDITGNRTEADISLVPDVRVGDYVLVHAGYAIQKYDEAEAKETLDMIRQAFGGPQ